jgi:hypothetical protein
MNVGFISVNNVNFHFQMSGMRSKYLHSSFVIVLLSNKQKAQLPQLVLQLPSNFVHVQLRSQTELI